MYYKHIKKSLWHTLLLVFFFLIACTNSNNSNPESVKNNQIILIFKSTPSNWRIYREAGGYNPASCKIEFINDNFISTHFFPNPNLEFDTLIVNTKRKYVEFRHSYKGLDKLSYIFQIGDTILFTYQDKTPIAKILNRETKPYDTNLDLFIREKINKNDYPAFVKFQEPFFFLKNKYKNISIEFERVRSLAGNKSIIEIDKEKKFLDSLKQNNLISEDMHYLSITRLLYQQKNIELQTKLGSFNHPNLFYKLTPKDFKIHLDYDNELSLLLEENLLTNKNDSLLYFGFHNDIINIIYTDYLSRKVEIIKTSNFINKIATGGSKLPNYLSLYDTISTCKLLNSHDSKMLKFKTIQYIIENNSINEAKKAFKKFGNDVNDTLLVNYIRMKYMLSKDTLVNTFDLQLVSTQLASINFKKLLEKYRGNVIYIDFWSSGCPPCIKQFEFSVKLKESYNDKKLVHIYISLEPDKNRWLKACEKYNLKTNSYFVVNRYTSRQLEKMKIKYVPHYIIYDKKGDLVNDIAPRPSNENLIKVLDNLLNSN